MSIKSETFSFLVSTKSKNSKLSLKLTGIHNIINSFKLHICKDYEKTSLRILYNLINITYIFNVKKNLQYKDKNNYRVIDGFICTIYNINDTRRESFIEKRNKK